MKAVKTKTGILVSCIVLITLSLLCKSCENSEDASKIVFVAERSDYKDWDTVFSISNPVPLEETDSSRLTYTRQCYEYNDKVFFVDNKVKKIYCFSKDGKYLCNIGRLGHAGNEYSEIRDVAIEKNTHSIVVLDNKGFVRYDTETGDFIGREGILSETLLDIWSFVPTGQGSYLLFKIRGESSVEKYTDGVFVPIRKSGGQQYGSSHFYSTDHNTMVLGDYGDLYIDEYRDGELHRMYQLDLCGQNLPSDMKPKDIYDMQDSSSQKYFTCILSASETDEWLYCLLKGPENKTYHSFFNKKNGRTIVGPVDLNDGLVIVGSDNTSFKALFYPDVAESNSYIWHKISQTYMEVHNPVYVTLNIE